MKRSLILACILCAAFVAGARAMERTDEVSRTFEPKDRIQLKAVSGDCIVEKSQSGKIEVTVSIDMTPRDAFEPIFRELESSLILEEDYHGDHTSGHATWTIGVPDGTEFEFNSASGDATIEGVSGTFEGSTASGDYEINNCSGKFKLSAASGDYDITGCKGIFKLSSASGDHRITDCRGEFDVSTASGDVEAEGISIEEESSFTTASGSVEVRLDETPKFDLSLGSASGDAMLDYNGNALVGYFELTAKRRGGRIRAPFDFDKVEEFEQNDQEYVRKSFTREADEPVVTIETASGKAELRK